MNNTLQMLAFNLRQNYEAREIKRVEANRLHKILIGDRFSYRYTIKQKKKISRNMYILATYMVANKITVEDIRGLNKDKLIELHKKARAERNLSEILSYSDLLEVYKRKLGRIKCTNK